MNTSRHIEELRDALVHLKHDAQFLYQHGGLGRSAELFRQLSQEDQKRLICCALTEGDRDIENVARHLMRNLKPAPCNLKELFAQMNREDRIEIERMRAGTKQDAKPSEDRVLELLSHACGKIGSLEVEEAYWVLIPHDPCLEADWVPAMGTKSDVSLFCKFPFQVAYDPNNQEKYELITGMRNAQWVLHIHNHPHLSGFSTSCDASLADVGFAQQWKSNRPELAGKMRFFVVDEDNAVEYSEHQIHVKVWIKPREECMTNSCDIINTPGDVGIIAANGLRYRASALETYASGSHASVLLDAIDSLNTALALRPSDPEAVLARGRLFFRLGNYSQSFDDVTAANAMQPTVSGFSMLGYIHEVRGEAELALRAYDDGDKCAGKTAFREERDRLLRHPEIYGQDPARILREFLCTFDGRSEFDLLCARRIAAIGEPASLQELCARVLPQEPPANWGIERFEKRHALASALIHVPTEAGRARLRQVLAHTADADLAYAAAEALCRLRDGETWRLVEDQRVLDWDTKLGRLVFLDHPDKLHFVESKLAQMKGTRLIGTPVFVARIGGGAAARLLIDLSGTYIAKGELDDMCNLLLTRSQIALDFVDALVASATNPWVRCFVAKALAMYGDRRCVELLHRLVRDKSEMVRNNALLALSTIVQEEPSVLSDLKTAMDCDENAENRQLAANLLAGKSYQVELKPLD